MKYERGILSPGVEGGDRAEIAAANPGKLLNRPPMMELAAALPVIDLQAQGSLDPSLSGRVLGLPRGQSTAPVADQEPLFIGMHQPAAAEALMLYSAAEWP